MLISYATVWNKTTVSASNIKALLTLVLILHQGDLFLAQQYINVANVIHHSAEPI